MGKGVKIEGKIFTLLCLAFLMLCYFFPFISILFGAWGKVSFFQIGALTIPSVGLFVIVSLLAIWRRKLYFLFLIFVILAFPAPIDDIFPSIPLTTPGDRAQVVFPLITRIDVYLILGILLKYIGGHSQIKSFRLPLIIKIFLSLFFLVFVVNCIKSEDLWDFNLLLSYSFHLRYFVLFLILLQLYDIRKYQKQIVYGFVISILFLFFEASINTVMRGSSRLLSGSLSLNTFANISAAIALYFGFLTMKSQISKFLGFFTISICILILIGSGTRGAILALALAYIIIYLNANHKKFVLNFLKIGLGLFSLVIIYFVASSNELIPERFSVNEISKKIEINFSKSNLSNIIKVKVTEETTSIKSRIDLFDSSLNMIIENPWTGIGVGRWNRYKNQYSVNDSVPNVLLDTHNDYLALLSQYGIPLGLLFAYIIFLYPMILHKRTDSYGNEPLNWLFVVNFVMAIAAISNAGFFKHQVSAVLLFSMCCTLKLYTENEKS
jgi:O-antigen ligase